MARPVIALLSDFGLSDHYVGTMKGVVLGICPEAALVDISHDVPPFDVAAGAWELDAAYRYFPDRTVFLVVVDPGVGSARRPLAVDALGYRFVAPDNGVLSSVLEAAPVRRVVELREPRFMRADVSRTFEGRDRFAPAAAWLATGVDIGALGPEVEAVERLDRPRARSGEGSIDGEVMRVDRFGNLLTNVDRELFEALARQGTVSIEVGGRRVSSTVDTYAGVPTGEPCALVGSSNRLEIAVNRGSAADALGVGRGAAVRIARS
jgi:S-adenosylmethionine hydrolase